jgi:carbon-monoxide dehydrogenase small subunit
MEIRQRFIVAHRVSLVWDALADAKFAAQCMPGAELDESTDGCHYKGHMRVKLGPLAASFSGEAVVVRDEQAKTGTVDWTGVDSRSNSRAKGRMTYGVLPTSDGLSATVEINADVVLTGALAQFGRSGIINDVAARLTSIFAGNLQTRLNAVAEAEPSLVDTSAIGAATQAPPKTVLPDDGFKAAELRPMQLFQSVLRKRFADRLRNWADRIDGTHRNH